MIRWTAKDLQNLKKPKPIQKTASLEAITATKKDSPNVDAIEKALKLAGFEVVREYKFLADRRFRFDLAIPKHMIAIEWEGAIHARGRHTRGMGYASDCKKYNLAAMHGWKLLRFTSEDAKTYNWTDEIVNMVRRMLYHEPKETQTSEVQHVG